MELVNIPSTNEDPQCRYKMPRLISKFEGRGNAIKTCIVNMGDVARALHRPPQYATKWFGSELGADSQYVKKEDDAEYCYIKGSHDVSAFQSMLDDFIDKYVCCVQCHLPEVDMYILRGRVHGKCKACGWSDALDNKHRVAHFIAKHPPDESGFNLKGCNQGCTGSKLAKKTPLEVDSDFSDLEFDEDEFVFYSDSGQSTNDGNEEHTQKKDKKAKKEKKDKKDKKEKKHKKVDSDFSDDFDEELLFEEDSGQSTTDGQSTDDGNDEHTQKKDKKAKKEKKDKKEDKEKKHKKEKKEKKEKKQEQEDLLNSSWSTEDEINTVLGDDTEDDYSVDERSNVDINSTCFEKDLDKSIDSSEISATQRLSCRYDDNDVANTIKSLRQYVKDEGESLTIEGFLDELRVAQLAEAFDNKMGFYIVLEALLGDDMDVQSVLAYKAHIQQAINNASMSGADALWAFNTYLQVHPSQAEGFPSVLKTIHDEDWVCKKEILEYYKTDEFEAEPGFQLAQKHANSFLRWLSFDGPDDEDEHNE